MKHTLRIFIVSILSFGLAYALSAQETNRCRFGVKAGLNYSNLYTNDSDHSKTHAGLNVGLFASLPLSNRVSLQPELYYTTKGADVTYNNSFVDGTASFNLNYLEVPLLMVVHVTKNFNIHLGPYAAVLISGKVSNKSNVRLFDFEQNLNIDDYNRLDAGIAAGVGIDIGPLNIGARYNYGLTKVGKDRTFLGTRYRFPDAVNGVFNVYVAVSFI
jgi:hypothetical protein